MNVAIVEDQYGDREILLRYLRQYEKKNMLSFDIRLYSDGLSFLEQYRCDCAVIFMDIEMPLLNGMETARRLRELDDEAGLVFVTNVAQYAVEGYTVQAAGYLLKPVAYYQFSVMLEKILAAQDRRARSELLLPVGSDLVRLNAAAVTYIEVRNHWLYYHCVDGGEKVVRGTIGEAEQRLAPLGFARCNQSFLVNMKYVERVSSDTVLIAGERLPVSRSRRKPFLQALTDYLGGAD
ncbi:MAG: LytTR family DNA-binding domain-containing protein [Clostridiales bacterium]|nr:LytTR family DNA-binding domain-containing protein [Clostridiales bacterium]